MQITTSSNSVNIQGNIKSVSDFQELKSVFDDLTQSYKNITVDIKDSLSITSSVIGYFNKLILKDGINLNMNIGNAQLMELLEDLNLTTLFKAKKI